MDQHKNPNQPQTPKRDQSETPRREAPAGDRPRQNWTQDHTRGDGGISNRDIDRELDEQEHVPERGERQSER